MWTAGRESEIDREIAFMRVRWIAGDGAGINVNL